MSTNMKVLAASILAAGIALTACTSTNKQTSDNNTATTGTPAASTTATAEGGFTSYETAFSKAKSEHKIVMMDVYTDWCGWCKRMDKDVYSDKKVQDEMSKYFTAMKLNAEAPTMHDYLGEQHSEQQIAGNLGITGYPTIVFMSPEGKVIRELPGYVPANEFVYVLRYIGSGAYQQNSDFTAWRKTQQS